MHWRCGDSCSFPYVIAGTLLQHVSTASYAEPCISHYRRNVRPPSVCHTLVLCQNDRYRIQIIFTDGFSKD